VIHLEISNFGASDAPEFRKIRKRDSNFLDRPQNLAYDKGMRRGNIFTDYFHWAQEHSIANLECDSGVAPKERFHEVPKEHGGLFGRCLKLHHSIDFNETG
jgi:hypothetical protein